MNTTHTVMIIEDEDLLLQAISKKFEKNGVKTVGCTSSSQALDYLKSMPQLPDAIWLDYYLKDGNGLEFMQQMKSDPKLEAIPVIVVSNSASDDKVKTLLALGVQKYFLKAEHRLDELIDELKQFIDEDKATAKQ
ncbi:MAG: response regulator [Weeksellaceae bacterium]